ncbi:MAG: ATP synthase F1 subunit delta, partial [Gammaproteobacteria bacterium]
MAENTTIARPYARAVFEVARDQGRFAEWSAMLQALEQVVAIPEVADLAGDPRLTPEQLAGVVAEAAGKALDSQGTNFVQLLAEKDRLTLVPEIHTLFEELR